MPNVSRPGSLPVPARRLPLLALGMLSLVAGVGAGLARLTPEMPAAMAARSAVHGVLMVSAFFGTVISLERAVALGRRWPFAAPLCAGLGGLVLIMGQAPTLAAMLFAVAALVLTAASVRIVLRQRALFTLTLAVGAGCWLIGNLSWLVDGSILAAVPWWTLFLVLTIAGERLELTRFLPTPALAKPFFVAVTALLLLGAVAWPGKGAMLFHASLALLAAWLLRFDIARVTVRQQGLTRFIAVCLLSGYAWLAAAAAFGLADDMSAAGLWRDAALHAVFLGFVFSMVFGHALVIFPAVTRLRIPYHPMLYLPLLALHASLVLRMAGDAANTPTLRLAGALGNAVALALFVLTLAGCALRGRAGAAATVVAP